MFRRFSVPIAVVSAGALVAGLLATGVFALVTDTVQITDGEVTSADYLDPGDSPLDLQIGPAVSLTSCAGVTYENDDVISFSDAVVVVGTEIDLTSAIEGSTASSKNLAVYCIRNATGGEYGGALSVTLLSRSNAEIGACNVTELAAETALGTATCGAGDAGELQNVIDIGVRVGSPDCLVSGLSATARFAAADAPGTTKPIDVSSDPGVAIQLADGGECILFVTALFSQTASTDEYKAAATDRIDFDLAINLVDPTA
jgi:hypothetical protein